MGIGGNGSSNTVKNTSSPGLGFGGDDTWGLSTNSTSSGWPDSKAGPGGAGTNANNMPPPGSSGVVGGSGNPSVSNANNDALNGIDAFGIPEFEPGKPWKGPGMKNPDDDPTLTPGSVAPSAVDLMSKTSHSSNTAGIGTSLAENTLGLTSPTWSFNNPTSSDNKPKDSWSTGGNSATGSGTVGGGSGNSTSTLTPMGQDLWGKSGRTPPGLGGWPSTTGSGSSNGWSSGQNGSSANNNPVVVSGSRRVNRVNIIRVSDVTTRLDRVHRKAIDGVAAVGVVTFAADSPEGFLEP